MLRIFLKQIFACASAHCGVLPSGLMPSCPLTNTRRAPMGTSLPWEYRAKGGLTTAGSVFTARATGGE